MALREGKLNDLPVSPAERKLLDFIVILTKHAWKITDETIKGLRDVGWTDAQIAETVYIGSFFNMMVRIADAFGAVPPSVTDQEGIPPAVAAAP